MNLKTIILTILSLLSLSSPLPTKETSPNPQFSPILGREKKQEIKVKKLTLESIFSSEKDNSKALPKDQIISIITTGDVIPARSVNWKMTKYNDFTYPFLKTYQFLKDADLTLINLEAPLTQNCPVTNEGMVFCGNQRFVEGLKFADIDVVNLANNHTLNYGYEGLCQTTEILQKNNILVTGLPENLNCSKNAHLLFERIPSLSAGKADRVEGEVENQKTETSRQARRVIPSQLAIKEMKGTKLGFLGFNILDLSIQLNQSAELLQSIQFAKSQVDFLIVSCHWGAEYQRSPAQETINLAHKAVDNGADLIVGNHPHWYQPIEIYKNKLIVYAHGNFIFDQEWSKETKTGIVGKYSIFQNKIVDVQFFPIFIHDYSQSYFLEGKEKEEVLEDLKRISLNTQYLPASRKTNP